MNENPRTILAEFQKEASGRLLLFSVNVFEDSGAYVGRTIYDVERSRKYGYMFDQSGAGGGCAVEVRGIYFLGGPVKVSVTERPTDLVSGNDKPPWRSPESKRIRERNRTRRLNKLPKEFRCDNGGDLMMWLGRNAIQQDSVWCSKCRDRVPGDDLCQHVRWCDQRSWYVTPDDVCTSCIGGTCKDRFELAPHVSPFDGAMWIHGGQPEQRY